MKNSEPVKLKKWAESFQAEPSHQLWPRIEAKLAFERGSNQKTFFHFSLLRIAAVFVFVVVAIGFITSISDKPQKEYTMGDSVELAPLDLSDVSIYFDISNVRKLKIAYHKMYKN